MTKRFQDLSLIRPRQSESKVVCEIIKEVFRQRRLRYEETKTTKTPVDPVSKIVIKGVYGKELLYTQLNSMRRTKRFGIKRITNTFSYMEVLFIDGKREFSDRDYFEISLEDIARYEVL